MKSVEKHFHERSVRWISAALGMTKGRGDASMESGCWTEGVFHHISVGQRPMKTSKNISTRGPLNCRSLGCARDDKGEGDASMESGCWTEGVFHHIRWAKDP